MHFLFSFRLLAAALLVVLLPQVVWGSAAHAQTIENIAEAKWTVGGTAMRVQSNLVSVELAQDEATIRVYRPAPGSSTMISYQESSCPNSNSPSAESRDPGIRALNASVAQTQRVSAGSIIFFEITAPGANYDPFAIDVLDAMLVSSSGDREKLTVYETAKDTGVFIGSIKTHRVPPQFATLDCRLGIVEGGKIEIRVSPPGGSAIITTTEVDVVASPSNVLFDSETGSAVSGARVTLVDAGTGQPVDVFAEDGVTPWPSSVVSGETVTDGAGTVYPMGPGQIWFPVVPAGNYRFLVEPLSPYIAPSATPASLLAQLQRPDGERFTINAASFGEAFTLTQAGPPRADVPLDRPGLVVSLSKSTSRPSAQPGDVVFYSITARNHDPSRATRDVTVVDMPSRWLRLRRDTVRIDGKKAPGAVEALADGSEIRFLLGDILAGETRQITYAMAIRVDAPPGQAVNKAKATDGRGNEVTTDASIRIEREPLAGRMTLIGRVTAGPCDMTRNRIGIPGVRVMLEDGSFAVTDVDGRYHFEGLVPGTHVVQALPMTLPKEGQFIDCQRDSRFAGSANSRFVIGQGGSLAVADFHANIPGQNLAPLSEVSIKKPDASGKDNASGQPEIDWLALGDGPDGWLAPKVDLNPRAPVIRVAIRHRKGQKVVLRSSRNLVAPLLFEGTRNAESGNYAVSIWHGVPLRGERTQLSADIINSFGEISETIEREVTFTTTPAKAELVIEKSNLVADGRTPLVAAIRILDRNNRPLRAGIAGEFSVNAPYQSAEQLGRHQLNQLTGLGPSSARWVVEGDDGIARVELAPTLVSGSLTLGFRFDDGEIVREQRIEGWIEPGDIEWTVIGLAEGSVGERTVAENMERGGRLDSDLGENARIALYAKGRVLGKYLVTLAYDSAKQKDEQRLLGTLDPDAYYTVFADGSSRRFDAASREKLYIRIETGTFYALYGDFETGFKQTSLTRYARTATGVKTEARLGEFQAQAFAANISTNFRRDEFQGQGMTGPYRLSSRALVANSEQVTLEVRDRFRSEIIVSSRSLTRFIDYEIDLLSGTITFRQPVLSRDFDLNPQFIVVDYETVGGGESNLNAGVRAEWANSDNTVRIGAAAISDQGEGSRTHVAGLDMEVQVDTQTRINAELAVSGRDGELSTGWLVEAQHQSGAVDLIAYAQTLDESFGVGQQNGPELGRTKVGIDARVKLDENLSMLGRVWQDDAIADDRQRRAAQIELGYRNEQNDFTVGLAHFADRLPDGSRNNSILLQGGATRRLFDNRLELSAATSLALDKGESLDLPARHRFTARYSAADNVRLISLYEIADGEAISARTLKGGVEVTPWQGAQVVTSIGKQRIDELGSRSYAAFGLAQTLQISPTLTIDASIDSNHTLTSDLAQGDLVNPGQPLSSGGQFGQDGTLFEDFTAVTLGAAYRKDRWSATARGEYRDGAFANRKGVTFGAIRQLGEGSIVGSGFTWTHAKDGNGAASEILDGAIAIAHRPAQSEFAILGKLEYRSDEIWNAIMGDASPVGRTALTLSGDAQSRRLIASVSTNWSPRSGEEEGQLVRRDEYAVFVGARYNFDRVEGLRLAGTTLLAGTDIRIGISERFEVGGRGTTRTSVVDGMTSFSYGPNVGFVPTDGALLSIGYNVSGFQDEDFSEMRQTNQGLYASARLKFDANSLAFLGLGQ